MYLDTMPPRKVKFVKRNKPKAKAQMQAPAKKQQPSKNMSVRASYNPMIRDHLRMVLDPCAAPTAQPAYAGSSGTVQRFVLTGALGSGTDTACYLIASPGGFRTDQATKLTNATSFTNGWGIGAQPGYTFLNTNARGARCIGACLQLHWNSSEQSRGGSLACGVLPASSWAAPSTVTVDQLYQLLDSKERIPSGECEILWNPSSEDAQYEICDSTVTVSNFDDKNALAFAFIGAPGFAIAYTYTVIYEWIPKLGLGQPAHSTVVRSIPDAVSQINTALSNMGFKNKPLMSLANKALSTAASYSAAGTAYRVLKTGAKVINTLLP